jgi:hypothetical protein
VFRFCLQDLKPPKDITPYLLPFLPLPPFDSPTTPLNHHELPKTTMETTPVTGLDELDKHLDGLIQDPSLILNPKLFDDIELQLTGTAFISCCISPTN